MLFFELGVGFGQFYELQSELLILISFLLKFHFLVPKGLLKVRHFFIIPLWISTLSHLLLDNHILLHGYLLKLVSESEALVNVYSEFDLNLLCFGQLDVSFKLLNQFVLIHHLLLQVSIVLFQLGYDEAFVEVMHHLRVFACVRGHKRLLKFQRQFFKLFIPGVQLLLNLLNFCFQLNVFVLGNVVLNFQISELILQVFLLHFGEECHVLVVLLGFLAKDHFAP